MNLSSMNPQQIDEYYRTREAVRRATEAQSKKKSSNPAIKKSVVWVTILIIVAVFAGFASDAFATQWDLLMGSNTRECINGASYDGRVPASYDGDMERYVNEVNPTHIAYNPTGCEQVTFGNQEQQ